MLHNLNGNTGAQSAFDSDIDISPAVIPKMVLSKMEFMLESIRDRDSLKKALSNEPDIVNAVIGKEAVVLETPLNCDAASSLLERLTGGRAVLQGYGDGPAAVAMMNGTSGCGIIRLSNSTNNTGSLIDGTIDNLPPGNHSVEIRTSGDLSQGCESLGPVWNPCGNLGTIDVGPTGRANFKFIIPDLKISDVIGRSLAISSNDKRFTCGVIARSAGLFQNSKKICACDGVVLWDERNVPVAGKGRRQAEPKL